MKSNYIQTVKMLCLALILGVGASYLSAWTGPTQTPPAGNTPAPINVGLLAQNKDGVLGVGGLGVFGQFQLLDGTQGLGKILTSDADGKASWKPFFGSWKGQGEGGVTYVKNTAYLAETDGFVVASIGLSGITNGRARFTGETRLGSSGNFIFRTAMMAQSIAAQDGKEVEIDIGSFTMPVRKGEYWKVGQNEFTTGLIGDLRIYWIPLGA